MNPSTAKLPNKQPTLRVTTQPNDANADGDIFGGWLMSQIDIAGASVATTIAKGRIATVAVESLRFINPLFVYDLVSFYAEVAKLGNTSMTVVIDVFAQRDRRIDQPAVHIASATYVYVAIERPGVKRKISLSP